MDINNSNISSTIANSISKLNLSTSTSKPLKQQVETPNIEVEKETFKNEDIALIQEKEPNNKINVEDIQKYANMMGEELSIDDINYGLMYGRSVIADYSV